LKNQDGVELNLENVNVPTPTTNNVVAPAPSTPSVYRQGSPGTPNRRPISVRIESMDQRKQRLAKEEAGENEKAHSKAPEEEAVKGCLQKEEEAKEKARLKKKEERRLRKLANKSETQRQKEEQEHKRKLEEGEQKEKEPTEREEKEKAELERADKDLTEAKRSTITTPSKVLATARFISDISSVQYPEGVSSPRPDLNKNAKEGKFR